MENLSLGTHWVLRAVMRTDFASGIRRLSCGIILVGAATACDSEPVGPGGLPGGVEIRAAATVFNVATVNGEKTAIVATTVVNNGFTTILFHYCGDRVYKKVGQDWVEVWAEECAAVIGVFTELGPGGVRSGSTFLSNPSSPFSLGPPFKFESGALYRVSVPILVKTGEGPDDFDFIDPRQTMSTAFTLAM